MIGDNTVDEQSTLVVALGRGDRGPVLALNAQPFGASDGLGSEADELGPEDDAGLCTAPEATSTLKIDFEIAATLEPRPALIIEYSRCQGC